MPIHDVLAARLRRLSIVPRWTIVPTINQQNDADHSFHVSWIALWLTQYHRQRYHTQFERDVMMYALVHDSSESIYGDIPSTAKRMMRPNHDFNAIDRDVMPPFSDEVKSVVKMADYIEALLTLTEERAMGNRRIDDVYNDVWLNADETWARFHWDIGLQAKPTLENLFARLCRAIHGANF